MRNLRKNYADRFVPLRSNPRFNALIGFVGNLLLSVVICQKPQTAHKKQLVSDFEENNCPPPADTRPTVVADSTRGKPSTRLVR